MPTIWNVVNSDGVTLHCSVNKEQSEAFINAEPLMINRLPVDYSE